MDSDVGNSEIGQSLEREESREIPRVDPLGASLHCPFPI